MAKVEQHDMREYYIFLNLDIGTGEEWHIPVPQAGYIDRIYFTQTTAAGSADTDLTFFINSVATSPVGMTIVNSTGAEGFTNVIHMSADNPANYVMEPDDGDLEVKGGALSMVTDGTGTATGTLCIVIRP